MREGMSVWTKVRVTHLLVQCPSGRHCFRERGKKPETPAGSSGLSKELRTFSASDKDKNPSLLGSLNGTINFFLVLIRTTALNKKARIGKMNYTLYLQNWKKQNLPK